jgi:hypothetical protein
MRGGRLDGVKRDKDKGLRDVHEAICKVCRKSARVEAFDLKARAYEIRVGHDPHTLPGAMHVDSKPVRWLYEQLVGRLKERASTYHSNKQVAVPTKTNLALPPSPLLFASLPSSPFSVNNGAE